MPREITSQAVRHERQQRGNDDVGRADRRRRPSVREGRGHADHPRPGRVSGYVIRPDIGRRYAQCLGTGPDGYRDSRLPRLEEPVEECPRDVGQCEDYVVPHRWEAEE